MPLSSSSAMGKLSHPKLVGSLQRARHFASTVTLQESTTTRSGSGSGSLTYVWNVLPDYADIPCDLYDHVILRIAEERTAELIELSKFWTIKLAGYFPDVKSTWRAVMANGAIYDIETVTTDSLHISTDLICREFVPAAEPGV